MQKSPAIPAHIKQAVFAHITAIIVELDEHHAKVGKMTDMILTELGLNDEPVRKPRRRRH